MWRLKIWSIAFSPIVIGLIVLFNFNEEIGTIIMYLSSITAPVAMYLENKSLVSKGIDTNKGSPTGNNLANFSVLLLLVVQYGCFTHWRTIFIQVIISLYKHLTNSLCGNFTTLRFASCNPHN